MTPVIFSGGKVRGRCRRARPRPPRGRAIGAVTTETIGSAHRPADLATETAALHGIVAAVARAPGRLRRRRHPDVRGDHGGRSPDAGGEPEHPDRRGPIRGRSHCVMSTVWPRVGYRPRPGRASPPPTAISNARHARPALAHRSAAGRSRCGRRGRGAAYRRGRVGHDREERLVLTDSGRLLADAVVRELVG